MPSASELSDGQAAIRDTRADDRLVLQVWRAGTVMFNTRLLASGYAGVDNPLFYKGNTMMLLGDAKKMTESIVKSIGH
jgi:NAD/NADP transhydrogenase beta subunit